MSVEQMKRIQIEKRIKMAIAFARRVEQADVSEAIRKHIQDAKIAMSKCLMELNKN
jgi:hypothetical protein